MSRASLPLKPLIASVLETAVNRYLAMDQHAPQSLAPLTGKVIALQFSPWDERLYICPTLNNLQILESHAGPVDVVIAGTLSAFTRMSLSATPTHALFNGNVRIEGDADVARRFQKLFAQLDINLESKLAAITNPAFAESLFRHFNNTRNWGQQSLLSLRLNLEEFLQEETRELPAKAEAEILFQQIDHCRSDFDRLQARIERLNARLNPHS